MKEEVKVELIGWKITNFKGIEAHEFLLDGNNAKIEADNGIGKSSIADALGYTLFDKDTSGSTKFQSRPNGLDGEPIQDLVITTEFTLRVNGVIKVFKRENEPKVSRNVVVKHENNYWIDGVPKTQRVYKSEIAEIIPEDIFKILTNTNYFAETFHWKEKRSLLLDISDEMETPTGFEELLNSIQGKTVEEEKAIIKAKITKLDTQLKGIKPRIDEQNMIIKGYAEKSGDLEKEQLKIRQELESQMKEHEEKYEEIKNKKSLYQEKLQDVVKAQRELAELGVQTAVFVPDQEKEKLIESCSEELRSLKKLNKDLINDKEEEEKSLQGFETSLKLLVDKKLALKAEFEKKEASKSDIEKLCFHCKQSIPSGMIEELEAIVDKRLIEINDEGGKIKGKVDILEQRIDKKRKYIISLDLPDEERANNLDIRIQANLERIEADREDFKNSLKDPKESKAYKEKEKEIPLLEALAEKENPLEVEQKYQAQKTEIAEELRVCNNVLDECDRAEKSALRIEELKEEEVKVNDTILNLEKQLAVIDEYNRAESTLIEKNVNKHFEITNFKMFKELKKGSIEQCCEITMRGVQYHELSTGEKILVGLDIIKTLSKHYNYNVFKIMDNAEGFHFKIKSDSQEIRLFAIKGVKELTAKLV